MIDLNMVRLFLGFTSSAGQGCLTSGSGNCSSLEPEKLRSIQLRDAQLPKAGAREARSHRNWRGRGDQPRLRSSEMRPFTRSGAFREQTKQTTFPTTKGERGRAFYKKF